MLEALFARSTVLHVLCFLFQTHSHTKLPQCPMLSHCPRGWLCLSILFCVRAKLSADTPSISNLKLLSPNALQIDSTPCRKVTNTRYVGQALPSDKTGWSELYTASFSCFPCIAPPPLSCPGVPGPLSCMKVPARWLSLLFRFSQQSDFRPDLGGLFCS